jgi:hypothetical protein
MEELKKFRDFALTKEDDWDSDAEDKSNPLDTNKFVPYPDNFKQADEEARKVEKETGTFATKDGFNNGGYDWCLENWGTKWGICHAELISLKEIKSAVGKAKLFYTFDCAWSPATPVIVKMSVMFPTLTFYLRYYEAGMGFKGKFVCKNGAILCDEDGDYKGSRGG